MQPNRNVRQASIGAEMVRLQVVTLFGRRIRDMSNTLMKTTDFEFIAAVARIYGEAVGKGLDLPLYLVAVGANGSVMAERNEGLEEQWTLAEHYEGDSLELPINLFVVDCKGRHHHAVIGAELVPKLITYPLSDRTH
jgi:hypothetical protein